MELLHQLGEMMLEDPHNCFLVLLQYTGERQQSILRSKFRSEWELFRYFVSYMHEIDNFRNESTTSCKGKDKAFEMISITFCSILKSRTIYKEVVHGKPPRSARPFLLFNTSLFDQFYMLALQLPSSKNKSLVFTHSHSEKPRRYSNTEENHRNCPPNLYHTVD